MLGMVCGLPGIRLTRYSTRSSGSSGVMTSAAAMAAQNATWYRLPDVVLEDLQPNLCTDGVLVVQVRPRSLSEGAEPIIGP